MYLMKFFLSKEDITPDRPVFLAGYGDRNRKSEGVLDPIYAQVVLLKSNKTLLILTFDFLGGDRSFVTGMKNELKRNFGFQEDDILINFSHTHSSIFVTGEDPDLRRGNYSIDQEKWPETKEDVNFTEDIRYFLFIKNKVVQMVLSGMKQWIEGTVQLFRGTSNLALNRRLVTAEGTKFAPNYNGEFDNDLLVLQLSDTNHTKRGILFFYACHPVCRNSYQISSDYVGITRVEIENYFPESIAIFIQGCAAELRPRKSACGDIFKKLTEDEIQEIGSGFANEIVGLLNNDNGVIINGDFRTKLVDVQLQTTEMSLAEIESILTDPTKGEARKRAARRMIRAIREGTEKRSIQHYIQCWDLDRQTRLIAMEGEVSTEYSLKIKKLFLNKTTIVLGYSNGVSTYIPTAKMALEGGYETEIVLTHDLRGPLTPDVEQTIFEQIVNM
ncbi:hypothetical protein SAMN04487897_11319 [Paenibacillus sp. yr247]|uniref:hypothetical protein n=1 Tax=Paenibacillus sp. yr247 TaxID=1761880 RepID=UPI000884CAC2|nr:hypothetical protein [Paenibacillus sp. yr247]SDO37858.1 hypothetical protein SAMN04487897_11319 [Paenibacillus sp. yr247]